MNKVEKVVDNVNEKVESLNNVFNLIDFTTDKLAAFTDRIVDIAVSIFSKLLFKKKRKKDDYEEE